MLGVVAPDADDLAGLRDRWAQAVERVGSEPGGEELVEARGGVAHARTSTSSQRCSSARVSVASPMSRPVSAHASARTAARSPDTSAAAVRPSSLRVPSLMRRAAGRHRAGTPAPASWSRPLLVTTLPPRLWSTPGEVAEAATRLAHDQPRGADVPLVDDRLDRRSRWRPRRRACATRSRRTRERSGSEPASRVETVAPAEAREVAHVGHRERRLGRAWPPTDTRSRPSPLHAPSPRAAHQRRRAPAPTPPRTSPRRGAAAIAASPRRARRGRSSWCRRWGRRSSAIRPRRSSPAPRRGRRAPDGPWRPVCAPAPRPCGPRRSRACCRAWCRRAGRRRGSAPW